MDTQQHLEQTYNFWGLAEHLAEKMFTVHPREDVCYFSAFYFKKLLAQSLLEIYALSTNLRTQYGVWPVLE